jgi:hypothetical protein
MRNTELSPRARTIALVAFVSTISWACSSASDVAPASQPEPAAPAAAAPAAMPATGGASLASGVYTEAQAERGYLVWRDTCAECHGENEMYGADFMFAWEGESLGRLYRLISRQMPDDDPGSLPTESYVDVLTYILQLNDYPAGSSDLTADEDRLNALTIEG